MINNELKYEVFKNSRVVVKDKDIMYMILFGVMGKTFNYIGFYELSIACNVLFYMSLGAYFYYLFFFNSDKAQEKEYKRRISILEENKRRISILEEK